MNAFYIILLAFMVFLLAGAGTIVVLWIAMPFSVFGTKDLLKKLIEEQEKTNRLLKSMMDHEARKEDVFRQEDAADRRDNTH